jgi:hypothetical protein
MSWKRALIVGIAGLLALAAPALPGGGPLAGQGEARAAEFETSPLTIVTLRGRFALTGELAVTADQRRQGLQYRRFLAADSGMLFDFGETAPAAMWMLNTPIPLDMVFIDAAGWVTHVAENTTPYSLDVIPSDGPVRAVLEVAAGTAQRLAIRKGARIQHPLFEGR